MVSRQERQPHHHNVSCGGARESFKGSLRQRCIERVQDTGCGRVSLHSIQCISMELYLNHVLTNMPPLDEEYQPFPPLRDTMPPNVCQHHHAIQ